MQTLVVVKMKVAREILPGLVNSAVVFQINLFILLTCEG